GRGESRGVATTPSRPSVSARRSRRRFRARSSRRDMDSAMKDVLETMIAAANAGGAILRDRFQHLSELEIIEKGTSDFVSAADLASEEAIKKFFPGARFQAEETKEGRVTSGERFIIDP